MMKFVLTFMCFVSLVASASEISDAFGKKNFRRVVDIYRDAQNTNYSATDLIYISFALRKSGFYRQDIKLNVRIIKKRYANYHKRLLSMLRKSETIDGDEFPDALKVLYWNLMNDYGKIIEGYNDKSQLIEKDHQHYLIFSRLLSELEFREGKVDKFNDKIMAHLQYLENKIYRFSSSLYLQYISWQTDAELKGPASITGLVVTNRGFCAGGDIGVENYRFHYYVDGCVFAGAGGVSADSSSPIKYQQSNVPAVGIKAGPGVSLIVSSSKSRIGLKLPIVYTIQKLQEPNNAGYAISDSSSLSFVGTLYSRWQFNNWYFQTEFGKYLQQEQTLWGLGIGRNF